VHALNMDQDTSDSDCSNDSCVLPLDDPSDDLTGQSEAILHLPVEVVIMILSRVPVRSLLKLRIASKAFRALIDGLAPAIVRPTILLDQARIRAEAQYHSDSTEYPFEQAIQRGYDYYGPGFGNKDIILCKGLLPHIRLNFCDVWVEKAFPNLVNNRAALDTAVDLEYLLEEVLDRKCSMTDLHRRLQCIKLRLTLNGCDPPAIVDLSDAILRLDLVDIFPEPVAGQTHGLCDAIWRPPWTTLHGECHFVDAYRDDGRWTDFEAMKSWLGLADIELEHNLATKIRASAKGCVRSKVRGTTRAKMVHFKRAVALEEIFIW